MSGRGDFAAYIDVITNGEPKARTDDVAVGPTDETPFDICHDIPFHETGDWPPSPQELMSRFLPREVLDQYAFTYIDNRGVSVSVVDWDTCDDILTALTNMGYLVVENPRVADLAQDAAMG